MGAGWDLLGSKYSRRRGPKTSFQNIPTFKSQENKDHATKEMEQRDWWSRRIKIKWWPRIQEWDSDNPEYRSETVTSQVIFPENWVKKWLRMKSEPPDMLWDPWVSCSLCGGLPNRVQGLSPCSNHICSSAGFGVPCEITSEERILALKTQNFGNCWSTFYRWERGKKVERGFLCTATPGQKV